MRTLIRKARKIHNSCRPWSWLSLLIFVAILIAGIFTTFWNPPQTLAALIYPTKGQITNAEGSNTVQFQSVQTLLSDGQFVWGPNVGNFNIEAFLNGHDSPLASYAKSIESWARYYSINPRVVLALLESNYGLISNFDPSANPDTIHQLIEKTSVDLSLAFLQHMYEMGVRQKGRAPVFAQGGQSFKFEDGTLAELTWSPSSASYALAAVESKGKLQNPGLSTQAIGGIGDFEAAFGYFFPETDPLDTSNNLEPDTPPPDDYFQLPFPLGATWTFSGVHSWSGSAAYPDRSSLDFSTPWSNYPDSPYKNTVAAAPGNSVIIEPNPVFSDTPCWVEIDHGGGWSTHYYHLVNLGSPGAVGPNSQNQLIGGIGEETCNGGWASGPHVHFALFYNGAPYDLEGLKFSGWTIHEEPLGDNLYSAGSIERDGVTLTPWHWLTNDYHTYYGNALDASLRFFGNTSSDVDRLKIPIDDPARANPGPPMDVGFTDFVIEWWMKANPSDNSAPAIACGTNDNWKAGNIIFNRSRSAGTHEWGVSLAEGYVAFGVTGPSGDSLTICSSARVDDGAWHHIMVQRNRWDSSSGYFDGSLWLFVDGVLQATAAGPRGDISYPDGAAPAAACGSSGTEICTDESYLVIGGGKEGLGSPFTGWIDDIRISAWLRSLTDFTPPSEPHTADALTIGLLRFNTGSGNVVYDTGGYDSGTSNGWLYFGGSPLGPEWTSDTPFGPATPTPIFEDVPADYWAFEYINALFNAGYVAGCSAEPQLYCPDNILSRAEGAVFVLRGQYGAIPDPPYPPPGTPTFADVDPAFWGFGWIESLWTDGFTAGCGTDPLIYCPDTKHSRAEGSVFFLRVKNGVGYEPPPPTGIFTDVDLGAWYAGWVEAAYNEGILPECSTDPLQFCPDYQLDRAWAAYMMVQAKGGLPLP